MKTFKLLAGTLLILVFASGCDSMSNASKGGILGAGGGAVVGGIIGKMAGNTASGAVIGAVVGGTTGAIIGKNMDKRAEEMERELENATVEREGEGIKVTFDSGILFDINKSELKPEAKTTIGEMAEILKKYDDTNIHIVGHTDASGSDTYNQTLSEKRAAAVSNYALSLGIDAARVTTAGLGETTPKASNDTPEGKAANRRVEVAIVANEKMVKGAEEGTLEIKE